MAQLFNEQSHVKTHSPLRIQLKNLPSAILAQRAKLSARVLIFNHKNTRYHGRCP